MSDEDLFHAIVRATREVREDQIGAAVAKVRALIAEADASREAPASPDRKERGGRTRSAE